MIIANFFSSVWNMAIGIFPEKKKLSLSLWNFREAADRITSNDTHKK